MAVHCLLLSVNYVADNAGKIGDEIGDPTILFFAALVHGNRVEPELVVQYLQASSSWDLLWCDHGWFLW
jgi:hypothetical protein